MDNNTERLCDLVASNKELEQEELFLTTLLSKIDKQIHALQVEQLNIINSKNQTEFITGDVPEVPENEAGEDQPTVENGNELDLRPIKRYIDSEEDEEDEDSANKEEEEREFPNNSADFDYL